MLRSWVSAGTNWLLATSLFTACCALSLCISAEKLVTGSLPPLLSPLHFMVAGSTLLEYNVHRIFNRHATYPFPKYWLFIFAGAGLLMCLFTLPLLPATVFYCLAGLGVLSFTYSVPLLPFKKKKRLKDYGFIKILTLTLVWLIATTVLPLLYLHRPLMSLGTELLLRAFLIFALCLAFDIRDVVYDARKNIYTLPAFIGVPASFRLIDVLLILFILTAGWQYALNRHIAQLMAVVITALAAKASIRYSRKNVHTNVYIGLIDGVMLLYGLLLLL